MKAFFVYIYCILTGKNIAYTAEIETALDLSALFENIRDYKANDALHQLHIKYEGGKFLMTEIYVCRKRPKSRPAIIFSEANTTITKGPTTFFITIGIARSFLCTWDIKALISLIGFFTGLSVLGFYRKFFVILDIDFHPFNLALTYLLLWSTLILVYYFSELKYKQILKLIKEKCLKDLEIAFCRQCQLSTPKP